MNLFIKYFSNVTHQVTPRYLSSSFMGHSTAEAIMENLEALSEMKKANLLQVSVYGPRLNWSFLQKLTSNHHDEFNRTIANKITRSLNIIFADKKYNIIFVSLYI